MKSLLKYAAIALISSVVSGYIGYSYAGYEDAFYCGNREITSVAL